MWFRALDIKDAYLHVDGHASHRKFLQFIVGQEHCQFCIFPFTLATGPRVFTKVFAEVAAQMRHQGSKVFQYLDDWLLIEQFCQEVV